MSVVDFAVVITVVVEGVVVIVVLDDVREGGVGVEIVGGVGRRGGRSRVSARVTPGRQGRQLCIGR